MRQFKKCLNKKQNYVTPLIFKMLKYHKYNSFPATESVRAFLGHGSFQILK